MRLFLSFVCALLFVALVPRIAFAQTVAINPALKTSLPRVDSAGNSVGKRGAQFNPEGVNLDDCRKGLQIQLPLSVSGNVAGDLLAIWATDVSGADCTVSTARSGPTQTCYAIVEGIQPGPTLTVNVPIKQAIAGGPTSGAVLEPSSGCRLTQQPLAIDLQVLYLRSNNAVTKDDVTVNVKTVGPSPPSGLVARPGNGRIDMSWTAQSGEGGLTDIISVQAYCDPNPVGLGATIGAPSTTCTDVPILADGGDDSGLEAGTQIGVTDGGCTTMTGGGTNAQPIPAADPATIPSDGVACSDTNLGAGADSGETVTDEAGTVTGGIIPGPDFDKLKCGDPATGTGNTINAGTFPNNKIVAVVVAGTDSYQNPGPLSTPLCQFPETTNDFWQTYRNDGGQSGGGFCSIDGVGVPAGSLSVIGIIGAAAISANLRKRKRERERDVRGQK
ncbi:MAG TPA: hypothetical protein VIF62_08440 [Labilithrix sp.]|jgi:hypothetical protein